MLHVVRSLWNLPWQTGVIGLLCLASLIVVIGVVLRGHGGVHNRILLAVISVLLPLAGIGLSWSAKLDRNRAAAAYSVPEAVHGGVSPRSAAVIRARVPLFAGVSGGALSALALIVLLRRSKAPRGVETAP